MRSLRGVVGVWLLCVTLLAVVVLPARPALAAPNLQLTELSPVAVAAAQPLEPNERLYRSGRTLRIVGIVLTITGIAVAVIGVVPLIMAANDRNPEANWYWGGISMGCAVPFLGSGIPLWAVGAARMNRAAQQGYVPVAGGPFVSPTPGGLVAGLRVVTF